MPNSWQYLDVAGVKFLHTSSIDTYGGSHGIRDEGLLASAVQRAENKAYYEPDSSLAMIAASLSYGLIKNHAFIDGNKRVGLAALVNTLQLNGWQLDVSANEAAEITKKVAAGDMDEAAWAAWVESVATPILL